MPLLTMDYRGTCSLCGCRLRGFMVGTFRVNKNSLICPRGTLRWNEPRCVECGFETATAPDRWRLHPESQAKVDVARAKRGWAA